MKILLSKGQFMGPISGADETLVTYATQLRAAGHAPSVLLMFPHAQGDQYVQRLRAADVPVYSVASSSVSSALGFGRKLASGLLRALPPSQRLVRQQAQKISSNVSGRYFDACREFLGRLGADVLHVVTPDPSAIVIIRAGHAAGIPIIYQELGTPYNPPAFKFYYEQFTSVLPLCAEVAALSPRLVRQCQKDLPQVRSISLLPVMTDDLLDGREPPYAQTQRSGEVTFGFAARIEPLKGPLTLVEAFAAAHNRAGNLRLKVAGVGSQKLKGAALAQALGVAGRCEFVGAYTDTAHKSAYMRSLDVFVLPSFTEGTPNGIVEAMAHGLPIIASTVGGIPDMITPEVGVLVPPGDAAALAAAMQRLAADSDLRARMGHAARVRYEKLFSPAAVLPLMLNTYRRVAARQSLSTVVTGANGFAHPWAAHDAD